MANSSQVLPIQRIFTRRPMNSVRSVWLNTQVPSPELPGLVGPCAWYGTWPTASAPWWKNPGCGLHISCSTAVSAGENRQ